MHAARPDLAATLSRILAVVTHSCDSQPDSPQPITRHALAAHVARTIDSRPARPVDSTVITALAAETGTDPHTLRTIWDDTPRIGTLDRTIGHANQLGYDGERLAWTLITAESVNHHRLVLSEANKLARVFPAYTAEDLIGFGWHGLRRALRRYDPDRYMFSTYACPKIRGAIRDGIRDEDPTPKRTITLKNKVASARETLTETLGRTPTVDELAAELQIELPTLTATKLDLLPRFDRPASLYDDNGQLAHDIPDPVLDPADICTDMERDRAVQEALDQIDPEDAAAVRSIVLDGLTVTEAARLNGVTPRQIRARRDRGYASLRAILADWATVNA